jgi:parallel beta-helix repeat protein
MRIHRSLYASRPLACGLLALALGTAGPAWAADLLITSLADTATAGDGECTLRETITNANSDSDTSGGDCAAGAGADTITFGVSGTIVLSATLPAITDPAGLTLDGTERHITVSGAHQFRVLEVESGATLNLHHLTVANGFAQAGGGIFNVGGTVTVTASTFTGNSATRNGGGIVIFASGTVTVTNSTFSGNSADVGGGIFNSPAGWECFDYSTPASPASTSSRTAPAIPMPSPATPSSAPWLITAAPPAPTPCSRVAPPAMPSPWTSVPFPRPTSAACRARKGPPVTWARWRWP